MELLVDNKNDKEKISYPSTWKLKEKPGISGNFCGSPSGDNTRFCHTFSSALWYSGWMTWALRSGITINNFSQPRCLYCWLYCTSICIDTLIRSPFSDKLQRTRIGSATRLLVFCTNTKSTFSFYPPPPLLCTFTFWGLWLLQEGRSLQKRHPGQVAETRQVFIPLSWLLDGGARQKIHIDCSGILNRPETGKKKGVPSDSLLPTVLACVGWGSRKTCRQHTTAYVSIRQHTVEDRARPARQPTTSRSLSLWLYICVYMYVSAIYACTYLCIEVCVCVCVCVCVHVCL